MCNDYRYRLPAEILVEEFSEIRIPLFYPDGLPNLEPRDEIRIRDRAAVVRPAEGGAKLVQMSWAWTGPTGKPVFNFRSEGRRFPRQSRVLIPADGFYEFTTPQDPKAKRKDKWLCTLNGHPLFAIAGVVRDGAFAMLTTEPGADIKPFHNRQIVVLAPGQWRTWLEADAPEAELLAPSPAGALSVTRV